MRLAFQPNVRRKTAFFFFSISFSVLLARIFRSIQSRIILRPSAFDTWLSVPIYLRAWERVERASANCEMQEFKEAFFIRSATTPGVIVVIVRAIKVRARPCKVRRMYLFFVRRALVNVSKIEEHRYVYCFKKYEEFIKYIVFSKNHNFFPMYMINIFFHEYKNYPIFIKKKEREFLWIHDLGIRRETSLLTKWDFIFVIPRLQIKNVLSQKLARKIIALLQGHRSNCL